MAKRNIAFYDHLLSGHHVEYLYQIIKSKIDLKIEHRYVFIVPKDFELLISELIDKIILQENDIHFHFLDQYSDDKDFQVIPTIKSYQHQLSIVKNIVEHENIEHCVFMLLDNFMQVALGNNTGKSLGCSISGILLNPFGVESNKGIFALKKYFLTVRKYFQVKLMLTNHNIRSIYIIIDERTTKLLNIIHLTNKFKYVSDPVLELMHLYDNSMELFNRQDRIVFLLFGSLSKRKGIFKMLAVLDLLNEQELKKIKVVFAGKLMEPDKKKFLSVYSRIKERDNNVVELIDRYLSYREIPCVFLKADYIVMPYDSTQASSGILAHVAYYEKPVIATGRGLIKKQIDNYSLGLAVSNIDEAKIVNLIKGIISGELEIKIDGAKAKNYVESRNSSYFGAQILKNI
ncbi:glycosyltransferase [Maribellus sediminis]|uniref:glycosyltransferase n=1 Tax=Maribellus sediminis TaxID=2696285 RepID=UPI0014300374|nr:glycosyltransferase [Maribellus sediminis]